MLQCLPTETVYEVTHWFDKRSEGECRAPEAWKIQRLVFLKKPDARLDKGLRGFRAIALLCVLQMVHDCSGGSTTRGAGTGRVEEVARGR